MSKETAVRASNHDPDPDHGSDSVTDFNIVDDLLVDVQDYANASHEASASLKQCYWKVWKARRHVASRHGSIGSSMSSDQYFTATWIPTEKDLEATVRVVPVGGSDKEGVSSTGAPPDLREEGNSRRKEESEDCSPSSMVQWKLIKKKLIENTKNQTDEVPLEDDGRSTTNDKENATATSNNSNAGLHQRANRKQEQHTSASKQSKPSAASETITSSPSSETNSTITGDDDDDDDDDSILLKQLFGGALLPKELSQAQDHAKAALAHYIEAANNAATLLDQLNKQRKQQNTTA